MAVPSCSSHSHWRGFVWISRPCAVRSRGVFVFPPSVPWGSTGGERAVCSRHGASIKRPLSGFPSSLAPFQKGVPPSVEASFPSEYPPCSLPIPSVSAQHLGPLGRGTGKEAHADLPRSLGGRGRSQAVSLTVLRLKFMASVHPLRLPRSSWCLCLRPNFRNRLSVLLGEGESGIWLRSVTFTQKFLIDAFK